MYTTNDVRTNSLITAFWVSHACGIGWINYSNLHNYIDYFIGVFFYLRTLVYNVHGISPQVITERKSRNNCFVRKERPD